MSEKKYVVPEGMVQAAKQAWRDTPATWGGEAALVAGVGAALRWQSENPVMPTPEQGREIRAVWDHVDRLKDASVCDFVETICREWQRRMYLAPEPEALEEVKDLLWGEVGGTSQTSSAILAPSHNLQVVEAYRRGQKSTQQSGR